LHLYLKKEFRGSRMVIDLPELRPYTLHGVFG
jgi:hypothetical protein